MPEATPLSWLEATLDHAPHSLSLGAPLPLGRSNLVRPILFNDEPVAILKSNLDDPSKLLPEAHALTTLHALGIDHAPRLLGKREGHLVLSFIPHTEAALTPSVAASLGQWLATAHAMTPPASCQMKLLHDPLPLPSRLVKTLDRALRRARKKSLARSPDRLELVQRAAARIEHLLSLPSILEHLAQKRIVHRDLNRANLLVTRQGGDRDRAKIALIDFERAAATAPAWDFVKLRWWLFDMKEESSALLSSFIDAYTDGLDLPPTPAVELFYLFEAATLLCYFGEAHHYTAPALAMLTELLGGPIGEYGQIEDLPAYTMKM